MTATPAERLRASTRQHHDALESTGFARALLSRTLPLDRYVGQLAAHRIVLHALEGELSRAADPAVVRVWSPELVKVPLLDQDLNYFAASGTAPCPLALGPARAFARETERTAASAPRALLGFLYVLEGSTLGAMTLRRHVREAYRLDGTGGIAYYGSGDRDRWRRFTGRLDRALTGRAAQDDVIAAAGRAYRHTAALTAALSAGLEAPLP